jgi:hypothetical protein
MGDERDPKQKRSHYFNQALASLLLLLWKKYQAENENTQARNAEKQLQARYYKWEKRSVISSGLATIVIAIFAIVSAVVAGLQWNAMKRAEELTRESIIAANRAWLAPSSFEMSGAIEDGAPKIVVHFQNIGRFPATDASTSIGVVAFPLAKPLKSRKEYPATDSWVVSMNVFVNACVKNAPLADMAVVYPSAQIESNAEGEMSGPWKKDELLSGQSIMVVVGCFTYNTIGKTFHSGFCRYYFPVVGAPSKTWPPLACPVGNYDR